MSEETISILKSSAKIAPSTELVNSLLNPLLKEVCDLNDRKQWEEMNEVTVDLLVYICRELQRGIAALNILSRIPFDPEVLDFNPLMPTHFKQMKKEAERAQTYIFALINTIESEEYKKDIWGEKEEEA